MAWEVSVRYEAHEKATTRRRVGTSGLGGGPQKFLLRASPSSRGDCSVHLADQSFDSCWVDEVPWIMLVDSSSSLVVCDPHRANTLELM